MKLPKPNIATTKVAMKNQNDIIMLEIPAIIIGTYAVHLPVKTVSNNFIPHELPQTFRGKYPWIISHIPTGFKIRNCTHFFSKIHSLLIETPSVDFTELEKCRQDPTLITLNQNLRALEYK